MPRRSLVRQCGLAALALFLALPLSAHQGRDPLELAPTAPAPGAAAERVTGQVHRLTIDDRLAGVVVEHYSLVQDDGQAVTLKGAAATALADGDRVEVSGRRNGKALFADALRKVATPGKAPPAGPKTAVRLQGDLRLLHVDRFDDNTSEFIFEVHDASGHATPLRMPTLPEALHRGMHVTVDGVAASDGNGVVPSTVTVDSLSVEPKALASAIRTNNVLVILMRFTDSPANPFTQAQAQATFAGGAGSGSVTEFFKEASFGQQLMNAAITPWLATGSATPAACNWQTMGSLGRTAATAAGYNVASYQNVVYVFPPVSACGWTGLGYIGASGVWINGRNMTSVYSHELGHNFGLLHAGSLRCSGAVIGGSCSVTEYGDPFDTMGNQSAMHYNAPQKFDLGWIPAGSVVTHGTGTVTYTLNPIEVAGGTTYAVKVAAATNRTYWLEFRQPIGFDGGLASYPNNGVQVRVASPFETMCSGCDVYSNDTQLLDMTPTTSAFTDATLVAGKSFTDSTYGVTFNVLGATSTSVTVQVTTGGTTPPPTQATTTTALASSANPANAGTAVTFTATVNGTSPTGSVSFADGGTAITGCAAVALAGTGNARSAACTTSGLAAGTHSVVASYSGDGGNKSSSSAALSQVVNGTTTSASGAWIDDAVPTGATATGTGEGWTWVTNPAPFSGTRAHQSALAAGMHQHYFYNAPGTVAVVAGDTLYAYVYLDPANPPTEVMLQWNDGTWEHRAYWGANQIAWGTNGTVSRRYMGALPAAGQWVRLAVPAAQVGLEGRTVNGMAFTLYGGRATWDAAGRTAGAAAPAAWVDDAVPSGAALGVDKDGWTWLTSPAPFSGTRAHQSALAAGEHQHYFFNASTPMPVLTGDTLYAYVYLDPANPPTEVMLQWNDGTWNHRVYWGADQIAWGTSGTASRLYMGVLPAAGQWVRLAVAASQVGLEGRTVNGMAFTLYGGRATWDAAGRLPAGQMAPMQMQPSVTANADGGPLSVRR